MNSNMNIVKTLTQFDDKNIYYCDPIKNNVINDGSFIRIIYSTPLFALHGIYLLIPLKDIVIENYYNKYKCSFQVDAHRGLIEQIQQIEESILKHANIKNKLPQYKVYEQFKNGNIKIFSDALTAENNLFMLKISGIWENTLYYGLTYKFLKIRPSY